MDNNIEICDLTKIIPKSRIIILKEKVKVRKGLFWQLLYKLGYKEKLIPRKIDISRVSTRTTLEVDQRLKEYYRATEEATKTNKSKAEDIIQDEKFKAVEEKMLSLMVAACKPSFPGITEDWLKENTYFEQILEMFTFIVEPILEKAMGVGENTKKAMAAYLKTETTK